MSLSACLIFDASAYFEFEQENYKRLYSEERFLKTNLTCFPLDIVIKALEQMLGVTFTSRHLYHHYCGKSQAFYDQFLDPKNGEFIVNPRKRLLKDVTYSMYSQALNCEELNVVVISNKFRFYNIPGKNIIICNNDLLPKYKNTVNINELFDYVYKAYEADKSYKLDVEFPIVGYFYISVKNKDQYITVNSKNNIHVRPFSRKQPTGTFRFVSQDGSLTKGHILDNETNRYLSVYTNDQNDIYCVCTSACASENNLWEFTDNKLLYNSLNKFLVCKNGRLSLTDKPNATQWIFSIF